MRPKKVPPSKDLPPSLPVFSPRLFTTAQAAAILGCKAQSLRVRRLRGTSGPPYLKLTNDSSNARCYYPEDALLDWIASRPRFTSTGEEKAALAKKAAS